MRQERALSPGLSFKGPPLCIAKNAKKDGEMVEEQGLRGPRAHPGSSALVNAFVVGTQGTLHMSATRRGAIIATVCGTLLKTAATPSTRRLS